MSAEDIQTLVTKAKERDEMMAKFTAFDAQGDELLRQEREADAEVKKARETLRARKELDRDVAAAYRRAEQEQDEAEKRAEAERAQMAAKAEADRLQEERAAKAEAEKRAEAERVQREIEAKAAAETKPPLRLLPAPAQVALAGQDKAAPQPLPPDPPAAALAAHSHRLSAQEQRLDLHLHLHPARQLVRNWLHLPHSRPHPWLPPCAASAGVGGKTLPAVREDQEAPCSPQLQILVLHARLVAASNSAIGMSASMSCGRVSSTSMLTEPQMQKDPTTSSLSKPGALSSVQRLHGRRKDMGPGRCRDRQRLLLGLLKPRREEAFKVGQLC